MALSGFRGMRCRRFVEVESLYHRQHPLTWGRELHHTYYHHRHVDRGFHIDYVFASEGIYKDGCQVIVGTHEEWASSSDHMPVICAFDGEV